MKPEKRPDKPSEKEDYGATGRARRAPTVGKGTPMPDGRRNPAPHDTGIGSTAGGRRTAARRDA